MAGEKKIHKIDKNIRYDLILNDITLGGRYVFFDSLLSMRDPWKSIGISAQTSLNDISNNLFDAESGNLKDSRIGLALDFLQKAASFERKKETDFFNKYLTMYPEIKNTYNLNLSSDMNFIDFISQINIILKGATTFKNEVNTELNRIKCMRAADKTAKGKKYQDLTKEMQEQYNNDLTNNNKASYALDYFLQQDGRQTFNAILATNTIKSDITDLIISKYGSQLFIQAGDHLKLNSAQFVTLIKVLTDLAYKLLIEQYEKVDSSETSHKHMKQLIFSDFFKEQIESLLDTVGISDSLFSVAEQHNINNSSIEKAKINATQIKILENKLRASYDKLSNPTITFDEWLEQHKETINIEDMVRAINSVKAIGYYTGEDLSLTALILAHIGGLLGGGANPTDDIEAGKLVIDYDVIPNSSKVREFARQEETKLLKLQSEYFKQISRTTDLNSFQQNTNTLRELRQEQEKILENIKKEIDSGEKGLQELIKHVNIHTTVKGYKSAGRKNFELYDGFEGAAFGSNLKNQLMILADATSGLAQTGGITQEDIGWLHFAMINAGKQMIGKNNKRSLEDYFSIFVGFFMFNDAKIMIEDAFNSIQDGVETGGVEDLHLYQLNGVFVPSSYLLQMTYERLLPILNRTEAMAESGQGVRAILHTYDGGPLRGYGRANNWEATEALAESNTKLELKFLGGFFDLLSSIQSTMNSF